MSLDRRRFLALLGGVSVASLGALGPARANRMPMLLSEPFPVAYTDEMAIDPRYRRQLVSYVAEEEPGSIIVDPDARFLYLTREDGTAIRYGVGVGREGFGWSGEAVVGDKQAWPRWHPPKEMIAREPHLARFANGGMPGGPENPLGARALYLYENGRDTLYRIHGTSDPTSIGRAVSSGCIRLLNQDIIDLYDRVPLGTRVTVLPSRVSAPADVQEASIGPFRFGSGLY